MSKSILFFIGIVSILSCRNNIIEHHPERDTSHFTSSFDLREAAPKVRFEFVIDKANEYMGTVKINGTIFNDDKDTVYFLSQTGYGEQYYLKYDTARFEWFTFQDGNETYPFKQKISPYGKIDFSAYFKQKMKNTQIDLQFYYFSIPPKFDMGRLERERNYKFDEFILSAKPQKIR